MRRIGVGSVLALAALAGWAQGANEIEQHVCRAAIGALFGREPRIIKVDSIAGSVMYLSYVRKDDGTLWSYRCKVDGSRVMWGSREGRWRDHPLDEVVEYSVSPKDVSIIIKAGGQSKVHRFPRSALRS